MIIGIKAQIHVVQLNDKLGRSNTIPNHPHCPLLYVVSFIGSATSVSLDARFNADSAAQSRYRRAIRINVER